MANNTHLESGFVCMCAQVRVCKYLSIYPSTTHYLSFPDPCNFIRVVWPTRVDIQENIELADNPETFEQSRHHLDINIINKCFLLEYTYWKYSSVALVLLTFRNVLLSSDIVVFSKWVPLSAISYHTDIINVLSAIVVSLRTILQCMSVCACA